MSEKTQWGVIALCFICSVGYGADDKKAGLPSDENEVRVSRGIRYSVPKDWPMDERNGGISPVPVEDYMLLKFKKIDERLAALENALASKEDKEVIATVEEKKVSTATGSRFKSFEQKPATLEGESRENEKSIS